MEIKYRFNIGSRIHSGTYGSVLYIDTNKKLAEDNANLYYNDVDKRLGIGTPTPSTSLHVAGVDASDYIQTDTGLNFHTVSPPAVKATVSLLASAGNIDPGSHRYFVSFVSALGETEATAFTDYIVADSSNAQVQISDIPTSSDYRVTARRIYRTIATSPVFHFKLLATINDNTTTTYLDNTSDGNLTGGSDYPGYFYLPNTTNDIIFVGGERAILANTMNTSLGILALNSIDVPSYGNSALGFEAGKNITTGQLNTLAGIIAGKALTTGKNNTLIGGESGYAITGNNNACFGTYSGYGIKSGANNTLIGNGTAFNNNVSGCVFIGYNAGRDESSNNKLYISNTDTNNPLVYGDFSTFRVGLGTTSPAAQLDVYSRESTDIGLSVRAAASQSANLFQVLDSPGSNIFEIQADGEVALLQDSKKLYFGLGSDFSLYYDGTDAWLNSHEVGSGNLNIGDATDRVEIESDGDVNFVGGAGLKYGCINFHAGTPVNTTCTTQNTWYQLTAFDNNSQYNGDVTPDHTNDHITIGTSGDYQVFIGISGGSTTAGNDFEIAVFKNNGTVHITPITIHQTTPTANKVVTGSMLCFSSLSATDTIEAWVRCVSGNNKVWTTDHIVLNVKMIGGASTP